MKCSQYVLSSIFSFFTIKKQLHLFSYSKHFQEQNNISLDNYKLYFSFKTDFPIQYSTISNYISYYSIKYPKCDIATIKSYLIEYLNNEYTPINFIPISNKETHMNFLLNNINRQNIILTIHTLNEYESHKIKDMQNIYEVIFNINDLTYQNIELICKYIPYNIKVITFKPRVSFNIEQELLILIQNMLSDYKELVEINVFDNIELCSNLCFVNQFEHLRSLECSIQDNIINDSNRINKIIKTFIKLNNISKLSICNYSSFSSNSIFELSLHDITFIQPLSSTLTHLTLTGAHIDMYWLFKTFRCLLHLNIRDCKHSTSPAYDNTLDHSAVTQLQSLSINPLYPYMVNVITSQIQLVSLELVIHCNYFIRDNNKNIVTLVQWINKLILLEKFILGNINDGISEDDDNNGINYCVMNVNNQHVKHIFIRKYYLPGNYVDMFINLFPNLNELYLYNEKHFLLFSNNNDCYNVDKSTTKRTKANESRFYHLQKIMLFNYNCVDLNIKSFLSKLNSNLSIFNLNNIIISSPEMKLLLTTLPSFIGIQDISIINYNYYDDEEEINEDDILPTKYFVDNISQCMKLHKLQICEYKKVIHSKQNDMNCYNNNLQFPFLNCVNMTNEYLYKYFFYKYLLNISIENNFILN